MTPVDTESPRPPWKIGLALALAVLASAAALYAWQDQLRALLGQAGVAEAQGRAGAAPTASVGAQISGRVVLSAALQARVQPEDTVLIVARVLDGPRMPVAVLKRRASELPLDFTLDDSAATTPTLRLSPSMQLVVAARILRAGQAVAQPGDLQGISLPVPVGSRGLLVEINSVVQ